MRETRSAIIKTGQLLLICLVASSSLKSQKSLPTQSCASDFIHERMMIEDNEYRQSFDLNEQRLTAASQNSQSSKHLPTILTIPLVVHVIHTGEAIGTGANISEAQVLSAVVALNEDFRKVPGSTGDGNGVDTEIDFCLASQDPDGNPTNGINRVNGSSVTNYASEGITAGQGSGASELAIKSLSRWNRNDYYNIWIVSEIEDNDAGSGIQGYAYYPNSSATLDGAVIVYNAFGTVGNLKFYTNLNKVTTHELGHGLFLYHTFYGGSCSETDCTTQGDRVCDTPPTTLNSSCGNPACSGTQQVENYMDYTSQTCLNMFSQGQKNRMRNALQQLRPSLLDSPGCEAFEEIICTGDLNEDGEVGVEDFVILNSSYGQDCSACAEDLNEDGTVGIDDFLILNSLLGNACGEE